MKGQMYPNFNELDRIDQRIDKTLAMIEKEMKGKF